MEHGDFCNMQLGFCSRTVCVSVSRLWEYTGGFHHGPVKLLHMVLIDDKGNTMSAMVPTHILDTYLGVLQEGQIYTLTHFLVAPRQLILNVVDAPFFIVFRQGTILRLLHTLDNVSPKRIYRLSAIDKLPPPNDTPEYFVDILGVITGISPVLSYNIPKIIGTIRKRHVTLSDYDGHDITLMLWGEAADRFDARTIYSKGQRAMVIAVFIGTTIHAYGDSKLLAGGSACRWYVDEDIPEIQMFRSRCLGVFRPIVSLPAPHMTVLRQQNAVPLRKIPLVKLLHFNFFEKNDSQFRCAVRIFRFIPGMKWWTTCCTQCNHLARPATFSCTQPDLYRCSRFNCPCTTATLRYRLSLIGKDATGEAVFIVCGNTAQTMIGLPVHEVVKRYHDVNSSVTNMHIIASQIRQIPTEFNHITSASYKFIINVSANNFRGQWPSLLVTSVESFEPVPVMS